MTEMTRDTEYRPPPSAAEGSLVVVHAPTLRLCGARLPLTRDGLVLGRDARCDLVLDAEDVSRLHARVRVEGGRYRVEDLGSRNGTFVGSERVATHELARGDLVRLGSVVLKYVAADDVEAVCLAAMKRLADEDALTGLAAKRVFDEALSRELARSRRHGHPLCVAFIDVDHFKEVNDRLGHLVGDAVLRDLAAALRPLVRPEQMLARVGGDELALLLPDVTLDKANTFAEKIRRLVEERTFGFEGTHVTVSIGLTAWQQGDLVPENLVSRADALLYEAKRAGRNVVRS
jgi:two-component system cell cycle response regulator